MKVKPGTALVLINGKPSVLTNMGCPGFSRWCSIGYHAQSGNKESFLSTDFGLTVYNDMDEKDRFAAYREYLYEKGGLESEKGASIDQEIIAKERSRNHELTAIDRLRFKTRYFTDSGRIGTKSFG